MQEVKQKQFDLEERTSIFARDVMAFCRTVKKDMIDIEIIKQLVRSAGSVGANYIEANESLSKKDFVMRVKISRKEVKESRYWLRLMIVDDGLENVRLKLIKESDELMKIFGAIIEKCL